MKWCRLYETSPKNFGGVQAVQNFSLQLPKGGIMSMIGPNGAGKTTVFNLISGVYPLFQGLTVLENVLTALDHLTPYSLIEALFCLRRSRREEIKAKDRARELLRMVGLEAYYDDPPSNLPYGLQRKLEIARALAIWPKVLLLDEPAAGLNPKEV